MKKMVIVLIYAAMALAQCSHFTKVHTADFASIKIGDVPFGWIESQTNKKMTGHWGVNKEGCLCLLYPRGMNEKEKNLFFTKDHYFKNGEVSVRMKPIEGRVLDGGVIFRAKDRKNYYAVRIDFSHQKLIVELIDRKTPKVIYEKKIVANPNQWHRVRVRFCGKNVIVWFDGKKVLQKEILQKDLLGGVGVIASGDSQIKFDDIEIRVAQ
ncbi:family 16 glycoside hydrolase [Nitratiruptor sp. SB155-2]|uniref:family 16 glycoside hydrolase n=1 Tax=Nitratiruptor sp. (strain SB155-2) TaxID=387092 RepID=UPI0001586D47|nr:family 16 glycoside hydrolase [Nitratiruptor sp. SB155-2]BAF69665.1 conserved hypothetical protein [Nitratiruptor sp. SB155-2]